MRTDCTSPSPTSRYPPTTGWAIWDPRGSRESVVVALVPQQALPNLIHQSPPSRALHAVLSRLGSPTLLVNIFGSLLVLQHRTLPLQQPHLPARALGGMSLGSTPPRQPRRPVPTMASRLTSAVPVFPTIHTTLHRRPHSEPAPTGRSQARLPLLLP
ncbi:hypothetical protein PENSPDRAFT_166253 [Peniophora sp. CONT]|nr:hypothetical protein PENSPDRAFT_166253 [Peniophora sp. CONT]